MLTADIDPHCADIAATQHDCGAITVAASEGGATGGGGGEGGDEWGREGCVGLKRGRVHDEGASTGARPAAAGAWAEAWK